MNTFAAVLIALRLGMPLSFLWIGFLSAVYVAFSEDDLRLFAVSTMLLAIGLLIFCGVAFLVRENGDENGD